MKTILKHPLLFYLIQFTWCLPSNVIGLTCAIGLLITGHKPKIFTHRYICFELGSRWGGFEGGIFFFRDTTSTEYVSYHEAGHGLQAMIFGWFTIIIVFIPSMIRYHYRNHLVKKGKTLKNGYYDIWFEAQATNLGYKYLKEYNNGKN